MKEAETLKEVVLTVEEAIDITALLQDGKVRDAINKLIERLERKGIAILEAPKAVVKLESEPHEFRYIALFTTFLLDIKSQRPSPTSREYALNVQLKPLHKIQTMITFNI